MSLVQTLNSVTSTRLLWIPKGSARVSKELTQILELPNYLQGVTPALASYLLPFPSKDLVTK